MTAGWALQAAFITFLVASKVWNRKLCDNQIFWFVTISFWFFEKNTMTQFLFWFRSQIKSRILCLQSNQVVHRRQIQYPANCKVTFPISFHRLNHWNWRQDNQWMSLRRKLFFTESWFIFPQTFSPFLAFAVYSRSKGWWKVSMQTWAQKGNVRVIDINIANSDTCPSGARRFRKDIIQLYLHQLPKYFLILFPINIFCNQTKL